MGDRIALAGKKGSNLLEGFKPAGRVQTCQSTWNILYASGMAICFFNR